MSRSEERRTVAPPAGWKVTAEVIAPRFAIVPAEYVPAASSTTSPLLALGKVPLKVLHADAGDVQVFESLPVGDMNRFAFIALFTVQL